MADYIDREALRTTYTKWRNIHAKIDDDYGCGLMDDVLSELDAQPSSDVAPVRHGRWIPVDSVLDKYKCSVCGGLDTNCSDYYSSHSVLDQDFCPNCGALMDVGLANN